MPDFVIRWLIIAAIGVALAATGFIKGVQYQEGRTAIKERDVLVKKVETIKYVTKKDNTIVAKHEQEKAALQDEIAGIRREYAKVRSELDKRDGVCDLPEPVFGMLNRARTGLGPASNSSKHTATVPAPQASGKPEAGGRDGTNDRGR